MNAVLQDISKRYGSLQALRDVTVDIRSGTVHALVGENGAGKSTLMKILAGVEHADGGQVVVDGREVHYRTPHAALADGVTIIAQELSLEPGRTVLENVFLGVESTRRGMLDRRAMRRAVRGAGRPRRPAGLTRRPGRPPADRRAAEGRDPPGARPTGTAGHHGRADRGPDHPRGRPAPRDRAGPAGVGHHRRLRLALPGRGPRGGRRRHRPARRSTRPDRSRGEGDPYEPGDLHARPGQRPELPRSGLPAGAGGDRRLGPGAEPPAGLLRHRLRPAGRRDRGPRRAHRQRAIRGRAGDLRSRWRRERLDRGRRAAVAQARSP